MLFDSKEFEAGIQRIDKQLKVLDSELKLSQSSVKKFGDASDSLKIKSDSLTKKIELQSTKVEGLRKSYEESVRTKGEDATATQNLLIKTNNATTALNNMQNELQEVNRELKNQPTLIDNLSNKLDKLNTKLYSVGTKIENVGKGLTASLTVPLIAAATASVKLASDLEETLNKVTVVFDENTDAVLKWAETSLQTMGLSKQTALDGAALYGDMATSMGLTKDAAASISMELIQLSADMASFKNTSQEMSQLALAAIFTGETEALKKYGIIMTETNLAEFARTEGIKKNISEMNQQEKVMLRLNYVMSVTENASGDFERTNQGFANQTRILTEGIKELSTVLGTKLLPMVTPIIIKINELIAGFVSMDEETQNMVLKFGAFAAALGPGLIVIGKLTQGISLANTKIFSFGKSMVDSAGKVSVMTQAFGSKTLASINKFGTSLFSIGGIGDKLGNLLSPAGQKISNLFMPVLTNVSQSLAPLTKNVTTIFNKLGIVATNGTKKLSQIAMLALKMVGPLAIVGLLLAGLGLAEQQFGEQINKFLLIAIEKGPELINSFVTKIVEQLPTLIDLGVKLLLTLLDTIIANVPVLISGAVAIITGLANGVLNNIDVILTAIIDVIIILLNTIIDQLPLLLETGLKILMALVDGIVNNIDRIIDAIINIILKLIDIVITNLPMIIEAGIKILIALITGLTKAIPKLIAAIPQIISAIFESFGKIDWAELGKNIIDGLIAGLKAAKDLVVNTLKSIATAAVDGFKKFFGINSPSILFEGYGINIDEGLALGIDNGLNKVESSVDKMIGTVNVVPDNLDYNMSGLSGSKMMNNLNTVNNNSNRVFNFTLHIDNFENNRKEDIKQLMAEMEYIAKREILGNGGKI